MHLRAADQRDAEGIGSLIARVFPANPKADPQLLEWQYWGNPFGKPVSWVWDDEGEIVGHYASICYPGRVAAQGATVGVGIDAAVDPKAQGRRLFTQLAEAVYADSGRRGLPVTLCFPNDASVRGATRAGLIDLGNLRTHLLPLSATWMAERLKLPRLAGAAATRVLRPPRRDPRRAIDEVDSPPEAVDELWADLGGSVAYGVVRDHAWHTWRYARRPSPGAYRYFGAYSGGGLDGFAVTTVREHDGHEFVYVLELMARSEASGRQLIAHLAQANPGCAAILLAALAGSDLSRLARSSGLRRVPQRLEAPGLHFGVVDNSKTRPDLARASWSLSWGDLDHL